MCMVSNPELAPSGTEPGLEGSLDRRVLLRPSGLFNLLECFCGRSPVNDNLGQHINLCICTLNHIRVIFPVESQTESQTSRSFQGPCYLQVKGLPASAQGFSPAPRAWDHYLQILRSFLLGLLVSVGTGVQ